MYEVRYPKSALLRKYIVSFNVLKDFEHKDGLRYYAFPQKGATIAFLKDAKIKFNDSELIVSEQKGAEPQMLILGKYLNPLSLAYLSHVPEISINFTETGANYFFEDYFRVLAANEIQVAPMDAFELEPACLFAANQEAALAYLEEFLLKRVKELDLAQIEQAVALIAENPSIQTRVVAKAVHLTEKTLSRQFKRYVGCTSSQFKRIVKFRNVIEDYFNDNSKKMTELCYDHNYCDSPHFCKEISKISNFKPRDFFKNVTKVGMDYYPYIFH